MNKNDLTNGKISKTVLVFALPYLLSSFLQVFWFKLTKKLCKDKKGRRLFRMAPLHHHFEEIGWSERRVVAVFTVVEILFCMLAWFAI